MTRKPKLSVIICIYNMAREAPRTVLSAITPYQRDVSRDEYEVIVVDNGSTQVYPEQLIATLPAEVRWVRYPDAAPSPVFALNWAAETVARGDALLFAIDGARIFSDRLVSSCLRALEVRAHAFVYSLSWHLGPKLQYLSIAEGYNELAEDRMLAEAGWPDRPGSLYEMSVFAGSSMPGFFRPIAESNAFCIPRTLWKLGGGYDERFTSPGAGLANLEIFSRYVTRADAVNFCLLGEGTFHQVHGGIATSNSSMWSVFADEYSSIFGYEYTPPSYEAIYVGPVRKECVRFVSESLERL